MADTFARVELHERWAGDKPDYELLHGNMEQAGFVRHMYEGLKRVKLPTGMYRSSSKDSILLLQSKVAFAAAKTGHQNEGMIWRGEEMGTWGLEVVHAIAAPLTPPALYTTLAAIGAPPSRPTLLSTLSASPAPTLTTKTAPLAPRPPQLLSSLLSSAPDLNREWERPTLLTSLVPKR